MHVVVGAYGLLAIVFFPVGGRTVSLHSFIGAFLLFGFQKDVCHCVHSSDARSFTWFRV